MGCSKFSIAVLWCSLVLFTCIGCIGTKDLQQTLVSTKYFEVKQALELQYPRHDDLKLKANFVFDVPQISQKVKGYMRFKQDSLIWMSITPLMGLELARALATPQSVLLMNRIERSYCEYPLDIAQKEFGLPVEIKDVNDILFARYQIPESATVAKDSLDDLFWVYYNKLNYQYSVQISAAETYIKQSIIVDTASNSILNIQYEGKVLTDSLHYIPETVSFAFEKDQTKGDIKIKFSSVSIDGPFSYDVNIPSSYEACP